MTETSEHSHVHEEHEEAHTVSLEHTEHLTESVGHSHGGEFWPEFMELMGSPAHWAFEGISTILFDFILITIIYGIIIKKVIIPRLRKSLHEEIDKEHGVEHDTSLDNPKKKEAKPVKG